ncbi:MAG: hypothetical protein HZA50_18500 [Planctomycetes bacterium]|nr:hypothetical protein [Planctomycetota bacterium]
MKFFENILVYTKTIAKIKVELLNSGGTNMTVKRAGLVAAVLVAGAFLFPDLGFSQPPPQPSTQPTDVDKVLTARPGTVYYGNNQIDKLAAGYDKVTVSPVITDYLIVINMRLKPPAGLHFVEFYPGIWCDMVVPPTQIIPDQWVDSEGVLHISFMFLRDSFGLFPPMMEGNLAGQGAGGAGEGVHWTAELGAIEADIQADANNDSTAPQRPPSTDPAERKKEELAEDGGPANPTGLLVPVNRGFHEFEATDKTGIMLPDNLLDGIDINDPELVQARVVLKVPDDAKDGCEVRFFFSDKIRLYKVKNNAYERILHQQAYDVSTFGLDNVLLIEGISPSKDIGTGTDAITVALLPKTGKVATDELRLTVFQIDVDVDSNNDGFIEDNNDGEDVYEAMRPGRILTIDDPLEVQNDPMKSDVKAALISIKPLLPSGRVVLSGLENPEYVDIWVDRVKSNQLVLPYEFDLKNNTNFLTAIFLSGKHTGAVRFQLQYFPQNAHPMVEDVVRLSVVETISRTPKVNNIAFWHSDSRWSLRSEIAIVRNIINNGWSKNNIYLDTNNQDNDVEQCTVENFKNKCPYNGIIMIFGHGSQEEIAVAALKDLSASENYCAGTGLIPSKHPSFNTRGNLSTYYTARANTNWFRANWKPITDEVQSMLILASCGSGSTSSQYPDLLLSGVGGRVQFGYDGEQNVVVNEYNMNLLFGNMTGKLGNGRYRTARAAYGDGSNYKGARSGDKFIMTGNGWTTLGPAPIQSWTNMFPDFHTPPDKTKRKGCAGVLFDTYMEDRISASSAVRCWPGSPTTSSRRWVRNPMGSYGISLDFDLTTGGIIYSRAYAIDCVSPGLKASDRVMLSGDRKKYGEDYRWSFK